jgi:(2Fe-2S) ferredoxin
VSVYEAFEKGIAKRCFTSKVEIKGTGYHGFCENGSLVFIHPEEILYTQAKPQDLPEVDFDRLTEAHRAGADTFVTACPKCDVLFRRY